MAGDLPCLRSVPIIVTRQGELHEDILDKMHTPPVVIDWFLLFIFLPCDGPQPGHVRGQSKARNAQS